MSRPTVLRKALLEAELLDALPGLATALACGHRHHEDQPTSCFTCELHRRSSKREQRSTPPTSQGDSYGDRRQEWR